MQRPTLSLPYVKILIALAVVIAIAVTVSLSMVSPPERHTKPFNVSTFTLENGLRVVAIPNPKVPAVSHMLWYHFGAKDEPPGKSGVAHFLEHLMFKGTETYGKGEFSRIVALHGGNENAFTGQDFTAYFQNISSDKLGLVMEMEADRMKHILFDEEEVQKERDVVLEERSSRTDNNPKAQLSEQMSAALFLNHPYGTPVIGWRHEIEALTKQDAMEYYQRFYVPSNATLIVAGDISLEALKELALEHYGGISAGLPYTPLQLKEPEPVVERTLKLKDPKVTTAEFIRYYLAPSQVYGDSSLAFPLIIAAHLLGDSQTGLLYQDLVEKQALAASASLYYNDLSAGPSYVGLYVTPLPGSDMDPINIAVEQVIQNFIASPIDPETLAKAKHYLKAESTYAKEGFRTLAYLYGQAYAIGLDHNYVSGWNNAIDAVTAEQITHAAHTILQRKRSVTGHLLPQG